MTHDPSSTDDELTHRIARAMRSRAAMQPNADVVAARIEHDLAHPGTETSTVTVLRRRSTRVVAAGVVTSALAITGTGLAAAANPYSDMARLVDSLVQAVGIDWSSMPDGYTREQYQAFWDAGYSSEDVVHLGDLWDMDPTQTKARAGQMILDGQALPVAAGASPAPAPDVSPAPDLPSDGPYTQAQYDAFWDAGYTAADVELLNDLWDTDYLESKARAGQMILDGQTVPIAPGDGG